jgi:hypothetical protein
MIEVNNFDSFFSENECRWKESEPKQNTLLMACPLI